MRSPREEPVNCSTLFEDGQHDRTMLPVALRERQNSTRVRFGKGPRRANRRAGLTSGTSSNVVVDGGDEGTRTPDPLLAKEVLSQLSYIPIGRADRIGATGRGQSQAQRNTTVRCP